MSDRGSLTLGEFPVCLVLQLEVTTCDILLSLSVERFWYLPDAPST